LDRWFGKTVINSDKRFSYEEAQETLDSRIQNLESKKFFVEELFELNCIANIYRAENKKNGAIEFETDEVKFELDEKGKPIRIYKKPRLDTMKMIEEWMLLANREVAKFLSDKIKKRGGAAIFRIHDNPKMDRIEDLAIFVRALGHELPIKNGEVSAKDINALLQQIEGHASESLIKTAAVRSMAKAVYSTKNIGHFGLAFEYYTHFTSPIRRYPDLMIHRILENHLNGGKISKDEISKFEKIAVDSSEKEITVAEAERESIKYKQVEFMQNKVGQEFDTVISGVTEWGMYVEHPDTKVEGMIRLKEMTDDFYRLDEKNYCIVGERTKKRYSLGDSVRVRLVAADLDRKTLDFKLA
jgi:ribonuclease R